MHVFFEEVFFLTTKTEIEKDAAIIHGIVKQFSVLDEKAQFACLAILNREFWESISEDAFRNFEMKKEVKM